MVIHEMTSSDHHALLVTLLDDECCWSSGQHKPVQLRARLDLEDLDNLAPEFQRRLTEIQDQCSDLEATEVAMWNIGTEVLGLKKGNTGRKPYLSMTVVRLKKAIRAARTLLGMYRRGEQLDRLITSWQKFRERLQTTDCKKQFEMFFTSSMSDSPQPWELIDPAECPTVIQQNITDLRKAIKTELNAMHRATLPANIKRK